MPNTYKNDTVSKSWFCVFDRPEEHGYNDLEPEQIVKKIIEQWIENNPQRTCAVTYCISSEGLKHCHAVLEDTKALRFSAIKKVFPSMHIEPTKGSKDEAEAYINKKPPFDEKGEQIMFSARHGEIKGRQGQRNDLEIIEELLHQGKTPNEIMDLSLQYRRHDKLIRDAYYRKRYKETPIKREVIVYWHVGESGTGKSFTEVELTEEHGEENIYRVSEYENGFLDKYSGQKILFMDELRGGIRYTMLLTLLDSYKAQLHSRYTNVYALWTEIHITSVYPPDTLYKLVDIDNPSIDTYEQLRRRINYIVYHFRHEDKYMKYQVPIKDYVDLDALHIKAMTDNNLYIEGMIKMPDSTQSPFEQIQI